MLAVVITQTLGQLNRIVVQRNLLIERFQAKSFPPNVLAAHYFGIPLKTPNGLIVSEEYIDAIKAINDHTDDVIFFAKLLCRDLHQHGIEVVERYRRVAKGDVPKIDSPRFGEAESNGLMPKDENYKDWLNWGKHDSAVG